MTGSWHGTWHNVERRWGGRSDMGSYSSKRAAAAALRRGTAHSDGLANANDIALQSKSCITHTSPALAATAGYATVCKFEPNWLNRFTSKSRPGRFCCASKTELLGNGSFSYWWRGGSFYYFTPLAFSFVFIQCKLCPSLASDDLFK